jgi:hypothetical protein
MYLVYGSEDTQGIFDEDETLIDCWVLSDANFHPGYLGGFLKAVGVEVKLARGELEERLMERLDQHMEER